MLSHEELIKAITSGVKLFAVRHSWDSEQAKDFMQEGLIAALLAMPKYEDKPLEELCRILGRCAQNRILDLQRQSVTHYRQSAPLEELDRHTVESFDDKCERDSVTRVLMSRLSETAKRVFKERLNPSPETENAFLSDKQQKRMRKSQGKLVMGLRSETIRDVHIAEGLQISKATASRAGAEIAREGQKLLQS